MVKNDFKRRIVVTGGSGLVGSHLIGELLGRGADNIVVPLRSMESLPKIYKTLRHLGYDDAEMVFKSNCKAIVVALNNPHEVEELMQNGDLVFNCVATVSLEDGIAVIATNVELTTTIVEAAQEAKVGLFVHVSSIATLGASNKQQEYVDENTQQDDIKRCSAYSEGKFYSENIVAYASVMGLPTIIVNPSVIIGEGDWTGGGSSSLIATFSKGAMFSTMGVTGYVDVRDVARAMVELCNEPKAIGERFIISAENLDFFELSSLITKSAGREVPRFKVGRTLLWLGYYVGFVVCKLTGQKVRLTKSVTRSALKVNRYDNTKSRTILKFNYTPINQAVERSVKAYIQDKK